MKPVRIETFVSETSVEAFDEGVLRGLSRLDEIEPDAFVVAPRAEAARCELRAIFYANRLRPLAVLSQCVMKAALEDDLPEILNWAGDSRLPTEVRASYVLDLQRFAKKPGLARDELGALVNDKEVGRAAVWALAGALKVEALPLLRQLRESSPHDSVRKTSVAVAKKIEARSRRVELPDATPAMLPQAYASTWIEFDTDRVPDLSVDSRTKN